MTNAANGPKRFEHDNARSPRTLDVDPTVIRPRKHTLTKILHCRASRAAEPLRPLLAHRRRRPSSFLSSGAEPPSWAAAPPPPPPPPQARSRGVSPGIYIWRRGRRGSCGRRRRTRRSGRTTSSATVVATRSPASVSSPARASFFLPAKPPPRRPRTDAVGYSPPILLRRAALREALLLRVHLPCNQPPRFCLHFITYLCWEHRFF